MTRGTRKLHTRVGLIAGLPFIIMIVTALLVIHGNRLGLQRVGVNAGWLPGYREAAKQQSVITAVIDAPDGRYIGTKAGLYHSGAEVMRVRMLGQAEIRNLIPLGNQHVLAVASTGLWHNRSGEWHNLLKGNVLSANVTSSGRISALTARRGVLTSEDGGVTWVAAQLPSMPAPTATAQRVDLKKLVADIHTGNALFGAQKRWIWTDLVGLSFATMVLTGVWGWYRTRRSKARAQEFAAQKKTAKRVAAPAGS